MKDASVNKLLSQVNTTATSGPIETPNDYEAIAIAFLRKAPIGLRAYMSL